MCVHVPTYGVCVCVCVCVCVRGGGGAQYLWPAAPVSLSTKPFLKEECTDNSIN